MKKEFVTIDSADDYVDSRTYNFEDYAKEFAEWERINSRPYKDIILFDQGVVPSCTRHALMHINNWQNINEYKANWLTYTQLNPMDVWNRWDKRKYLLNALDQAKKEGLIEWYLEIKKDANMYTNIDKAINMWCYIYTWSNNWTWGIYRKPFIYKVRTDWKIVWHAFPIVDKRSDGIYVSPTSFGTSYWNKWYIYINPEDIKWFFTLFAIVDKDETWRFARFKNKEKVKQLLSIAADLYLSSTSDDELKEYFNKIQLSNTLKPMFGL